MNWEMEGWCLWYVHSRLPVPAAILPGSGLGQGQGSLVAQ